MVAWRTRRGRRNTKVVPDAVVDILVLGNVFRGRPRLVPPVASRKWTPLGKGDIDRSLQRLRLQRLIARRGRRGPYTVTSTGFALLERIVPDVLKGAAPPEPDTPTPSAPARPRFRLLKGGRSNRRRCRILFVGADSPDEHLGWADELFLDAGIEVSRTEEPLFACVNADDETVGLLVAGTRAIDWGPELVSGELTFSVAVRRDHSRRGIGKALVQRLLRYYLAERDAIAAAHGMVSVELVAWVVNPHMAALLEDLGFDTDGAEWSQDAPHMRWPA